MIELVPSLLWTDSQPMRFLGTPIGRRVAVVRNDAGRLVVFSPLTASASTIAALRALGDIAAFVVPSRMHDRYFADHFGVFPHALFLATPGVIANHHDWPLHDLASHDALFGGTSFVTLGGMPALQETAFCHHASRTLIVADALFNIPPPASLVDRLLLAGAGIGRVPSTCRLFRSMVRNRAALERSVETILTWDFDRIVPGHGDVIATNAKEIFRRAFRQ